MGTGSNGDGDVSKVRGGAAVKYHFVHDVDGCCKCGSALSCGRSGANDGFQATAKKDSGCSLGAE